MVFSFFKKKDKQPEEKMPERPAARPQSQVQPADKSVPVSPRLGSKPADQVPSVMPSPARPVSGGKVQQEENFTVSEFERNFTESSVMEIDVDQGADPLQADIEQVAILFANGQDAASRSLLELFVQTHHGEESLRFWAMYFDFLQLMDDRVSFDRMGLVFAEQCETSPPAWQPERILRAVAPLDCSVFELQGVLTADVSSVLVPVLAAVERKTPVRLVCRKLLGCDDSISRQLTTILQRARTLHVPLALEGVERLVASLQMRMVNGQQTNLASWHLCFELMLRTGAKAAFEECAVEFAVTFGQSPPSWVAVETAVVEAKTPDLPEDAYYLTGEIRSCKFDDLKLVFEKHRLPVLDFSGVRRMDFFSAGQLANRLGIFRHGGREVVIRSPNHLVAELMGVVGIHKYARILIPKS